MNVPHSAAYMMLAGIVSAVSIAAGATVEIVKTRTERSVEIRRAETRNALARRVEDPATALLLDTLDETMTAGQSDVAAIQATCVGLLQLFRKREDPHQVTGSPAAAIGDHHADRSAGPQPGESEPPDADGEGLRTAGMLIRIN
jgi:hypothetical protein